MPSEYEPRVGNWYEDDLGRTFEVVAVDEDDGSIEIQYFDGDVEELDIDTWNEMELQPVEEPEDWSGPFDDLERDDLGDLDTPLHPGGNPLDDL